MKRLLIILFLATFRLIVFGQDDMNTGIIYGKNYAFSLTAPAGWILDNKSGIKQGLDAVFYRNGESWEKAETVMYANTASLEDNAHKTLNQLIKFDLDDFRKNYSDIRITDSKDIVIKNNTVAIVKFYQVNLMETMKQWHI